ncbi:MAG: toll/interleukin-1 receptor domain-containing protein, partial [Lachnospiraceae bacterium]|nr:toll/interleukin-1 receptor domain-containing protein [Lachnospiraceae bacterium]
MKYDAFISYRHSELDMFVAKKIHKGLETFKVPRQVKKIGGKSKITRVFRDQEELPIGSDLGDNISGALKESEYLLVICSPRTPESYWVQKEIDTFISLHPRDHILAILVEGEPNESFPAQLLNDENGNPVEPLAADVRGDNIKEVNKKLKTEIIRLAAPILHCSYDDLRQRHRERRIKRIFSIVTAAFVIIAALGIGFGIYNAKMANEIARNYKEKQIT